MGGGGVYRQVKPDMKSDSSQSGWLTFFWAEGGGGEGVPQRILQYGYHGNVSLDLLSKMANLTLFISYPVCFYRAPEHDAMNTYIDLI